jgi:hypothetical protein
MSLHTPQHSKPAEFVRNNFHIFLALRRQTTAENDDDEARNEMSVSELSERGERTTRRASAEREKLI